MEPDEAPWDLPTGWYWYATEKNSLNGQVLHVTSVGLETCIVYLELISPFCVGRSRFTRGAHLNVFTFFHPMDFNVEFTL